MRKLMFFAFVLAAIGALAASGSAGTGRHHGDHPSIAAAADASDSWAEFSAKVPNLRDALTFDSRQTGLTSKRH